VKTVYPSEKAFIMSFVACLSKKGTKTFSLTSKDYYNGIENMQLYFHENRRNLGTFADEFAMLFLKNSNGEYRQFNIAIESLNAGMLSFDNPYYIAAHVEIDEEEAEKVMETYSNYIPIQYIDGFVDAFKNVS
jgi:hypothetical protein